MVCNEERLGSNLIKAMKSDQIAHRQIKRAQVFFKVASRLNPVLSALWKWCICRMTSLEVQKSRWDWSKGVTMCFCLTAFQDWKLHFLFESYFFFRLLLKDETRLRRSRQARLNFDRQSLILLWDKRLLQHFDTIFFFPRENINNNSTLHVLLVIQQKQTTENWRVQSLFWNINIYWQPQSPADLC